MVYNNFDSINKHMEKDLFKCLNDKYFSLFLFVTELFKSIILTTFHIVGSKATPRKKCSCFLYEGSDKKKKYLRCVQQEFIKSNKHTACALDIHLYLTPLGQARQFIETCGT